MIRVRRNVNVTISTTAAATIIAAVLMSGGCTTTTESSTAGIQTDVKPQDMVTSEGVKSERENQAQSVVIPMGVIPYDNATLPLVSPNGRFVATQTGVAPEFETLIANPDGELPAASKVEVFMVGPRTQDDPDVEPQYLHRLDMPVLLGRSVDAEGYLVELPRPNGSRWIGKASWLSSDIDWLVKTGDINAFAAHHAQSGLAYSRSDDDGASFQLVVRGRDGNEWAFGGPDEDWLMPMWSGRDDGLFVLRLVENELRLVYGVATDRTSFRLSFQEFTVATGMTRGIAYQTLAALTNIADGDRAPSTALPFFHPMLGRMAVWRPLATTEPGLTLNPKSFAALSIDRTYALVSTDTKLVRQNLNDSGDAVTLARGLQIARRVTNPEWPLVDSNQSGSSITRVSTPFMLMSPREGEIQLLALYLITG